METKTREDRTDPALKHGRPPWAAFPYITTEFTRNHRCACPADLSAAALAEVEASAKAGGPDSGRNPGLLHFG